MNYIVSIFPILLYLALIKGLDGFALAKWSRIIECTVWGVITCVIGYVAGLFIEGDSEALFPLLEEVIKALPLVIAIFRRRSAFFAETLIYGAAIGAGFALLENILYATMNPVFTIGDSILRGFGTALIHIGCTAIIATLVLVANRISTGKPKLVAIGLVIIAIVPSFVIHYVYNLFLLPEFLQMVIAVVVMVSIILGVYAIDEKLIHKWLDVCINNDVTLFKSIKDGNLKTTSAGNYLIMARERFQPEVFFDICVYLGLYLELSIAAKSRMIMKEAELDIPLSEDQHNDFELKIKELKDLRHDIGTAGLLFLSPLVNTKATDEWVMKELL